MKKRRVSLASDTAGLASSLTRGAVAAGLLALIQERKSNGAPCVSAVARRALQGGAALAAGAATATALRDRNYSAALIALAGGAAAITAVELLLNPCPSPLRDGATEQESDCV